MAKSVTRDVEDSSMDSGYSDSYNSSSNSYSSQDSSYGSRSYSNYPSQGSSYNGDSRSSSASTDSSKVTYGNLVKSKASHQTESSAMDSYSDYTETVSPTVTASDDGYGSVSASFSSSSSFSDNNSKAKTQAPSTKTDSSSSTSKHFVGSIYDFLQWLATIRDFRSWDPIKDIKEKLSPELLEACRSLLWDQDDDKEFEALNAARDGDERVVALALFTAKSHKQLNTMNNERQTVLHVAAETCSPPLCRLLITRGADGAIADVWGDTPLHIAARHGRADVIKAFTTTLTKYEVHHPYFRVPYKSLPQDNVQSYNHDGRTPIHLAAQENHRDALRALVKHARADIDYRRLGDGYAPAHIAIDNGDIECLRTCLKLGADSEVRNFKSETPQQLAYLFNDNDCESDMVKLCQQYGAGSYQLQYAETEPVFEEMDFEDEPVEQSHEAGLAHSLQRMAVS